MSGEKIKLMIGEEEREFSRDDLTSGIQKQTELQEKIDSMQESFENVSQAATQYGTDTKTYLESAESAFGVLNSLVEAGVIDETGAMVETVKSDNSALSPTPTPTTSATQPAGEKKKNESDLLSAVEQLIAKKLDPFTNKIQQIESSQSTLFKAGLNARIKAKHPEFSDADVETVMNNAFNDRTKDLWSHAESVKSSNTTLLQEQEKKFALKYGVNLEEVKKLEELKEQRATGGISSIFKGKRFSFRKKTKNDNNFISPSEALKAFNSSQG